jgi:hypothetical protein
MEGSPLVLVRTVNLFRLRKLCKQLQYFYVSMLCRSMERQLIILLVWSVQGLHRAIRNKN